MVSSICMIIHLYKHHSSWQAAERARQRSGAWSLCVTVRHVIYVPFMFLTVHYCCNTPYERQSYDIINCENIHIVLGSIHTVLHTRIIIGEHALPFLSIVIMHYELLAWYIISWVQNLGTCFNIFFKNWIIPERWSGTDTSGLRDDPALPGRVSVNITH